MRKSLLLSLCFVFVSCFLVTGSAFSTKQVEPTNLKKFKPGKIRSDTNFDGKIDRIEVYDKNGNIVRVEADTSGNGEMDEWAYYKKGKVDRVEKDRNGDGKVDIYLYYNSDGKITRSKTDVDKDGKVDEWVYYKNGKPYKAEKDVNKDGKADTWIEY